MKKNLPVVPSSSQKFIESFSYDVRLAPYDILGSIAHATMLGRQRIIPLAAAKRIVKGLKSIQADLERGWRLPVQEDIHFALERELIQRLGAVGGMVHTGRSRNDQVITDLYLYLKAHVLMIVEEIKRVQSSIVAVAIEYEDAIMPGFTHLQHAQPILFAHHILAYAWMLERDKGRFLDCRKRLDSLPLGSAALAGTSFPIDRHYVAKLLGFSRISDNSIDATASRDVPAEFLSACALLMSNLSRFCEELVIWSTAEFSFIKLTAEFSVGLVDHAAEKKSRCGRDRPRRNGPRVWFARCVAHLVERTSARIQPRSSGRQAADFRRRRYGCRLPLGDGADDPLDASQHAHDEAMVRPRFSRGHRARGFPFLCARALPFRTAHGVVRQVVAYCERRKIRLDQLSLLELKVFHSAFDAESLSLLEPGESDPGQKIRRWHLA